MIDNQIIEIIEQEEIEKSGKLNLSDMGIRRIPKEILRLQHLFSIDLSQNYIEDISDLKELTNLTTINLSFNRVVNIDSIQYLKNLEFLNISSNKISFLSPLKELKGLKIINVSKNRIISIIALSDLHDLQVLNISWNNIKDIQPLINHKNLIHLGLHKTKIRNLNVVCTIKNLNFLDIGGNSISNFKNLSKLEKLYSLNISHSKISSYDFLLSIKELKSLNLSLNNISEINFLKDFNRLEHLSLTSNKIENISPLSNFWNLITLNIDDNLITDITPLLPLLKKGLTTSTNEKRGNIQLDANPISHPPVEIVLQGRQSILNWFSAIRKELTEIKIILIGDPKAGKTSLLRRFKEDKFDDNEMQTDGINIEKIEFGNSLTFKNHKSLHKLTGYFWDFGGQEIMYATHQFFLTKRSVYLLVLDARKDNNTANQIRQWVKRIKATGGNSDIIIIANQIDLNSGFGFENEYEILQEFPQIKHFIKLSCKTGENISDLKDKLEELIPKAELLKSEIDERWINIKELLQEGTNVDYYLGEDRFKNICIESKLSEKTAQKNAISFLHDLGLVLHFNEVKDHEYFVLDPYWITYGVYQILTSNLAGNRKGIVNISDLEYIINEEEDKREIYKVADFRRITYNNHQRRFILDMLCQFKLCFYLPDRSQFIIPDLLETAEPNELTEPIRSSTNFISLVYDYEYLPKSVMPQIIVETHNLHFRIWRTGCILRYVDCRALIISYDNQIRIKVSDGHRSMKDLLAIIRNIIDQINERLTNNPKILIPLPGTNESVDYEELLERDKDGETHYKIYKPEKKEFEISRLLEGISKKTETFDIEIKLDQLIKEAKKHSSEHLSLKEDLDLLKEKLTCHFNDLIVYDRNKELNEIISETIIKCNAEQTKEITEEIMSIIAYAFEIHQGDLDEKLIEIFNDLKKTPDLQLKLKLGIPLINLLGIDLAAEFNIKSWTAKMYQKYELQIFKIMGLI